MGKSFSRHGRSSSNQIGGTRSSSRSPTVVLVHDGDKVAAAAAADGDGGGTAVRCRIVVDGECIDQLVKRTPRRDDSDTNSTTPVSMVVDIPIRVILSPLSSNNVDRMRRTPLRLTEDQPGFRSASPTRDQPPPPYRLGSNAEDWQPPSEENYRRWSVELEDVDGSPMKIVNDEVQHLLHRLSGALSNSTVPPSTVDCGHRVLRLRLVDSPSSSSTQPVDAEDAGLPSEPSTDDRLSSAKLTVNRTERSAFRLRVADGDQDALETESRHCSIVDLEVESSPWERLKPEVVNETASPTVELRPAATSSIPCCVARGRHCDLSENCKDTDADDGVRFDRRRRKADFDERQLAELVQRNMDLNVQPSRHRWRRSAPVSSPRRHVRCVTDPDDRDDEFPNTCRRDVRTSGVKSRIPPSTSPQLRSQVRHSVTLASAVETISCAVGLRCDHSASRDHVDGVRPTKTSSPKCSRNRTHGCSNQIPSSYAIGEDDVDCALDSPRLRKCGGAAVTSRRHEPEKAVSASHYHRRHRHRARDQSRAMRQVAEWIERAEPARVGEDGDHDATTTGDRCGNENVCRHEHYHYHYHYCIDGNAWGVC